MDDRLKVLGKIHLDDDSNLGDWILMMDSQETIRSLELASEGDQASLERLLGDNAGRLARMITLRMDRRLSGRIDVDDILQEVHFRASRHLSDCLLSSVPFYVWLRGVAINVMLELHRRHLGTRMRDARLEVSLNQVYSLEASSQALASLLADTGTTPGAAAMREEMRRQLETIIDELPPNDKEILALRHFEQLSPAETAQVLQISHKAAGMRYVRALDRLRQAVAELPGKLSEWRV